MRKNKWQHFYFLMNCPLRMSFTNINLFTDPVSGSGGLSGSCGSRPSVWLLDRSFAFGDLWTRPGTGVPAGCILWHGQTASINRWVDTGTSAETKRRWPGRTAWLIQLHHREPVWHHLWGHINEPEVSAAPPQPLPDVWHHTHTSTSQQWVFFNINDYLF